MEIVIAVFLGAWQVLAAWLAHRHLRAEFGNSRAKMPTEKTDR